MNKVEAIADAGNVNISVDWYVPQYTASMKLPALLSKQVLSKTPTELRYIERSLFMKGIKNQYSWKFELESQEGKTVPIWITVGLQHGYGHNSHNLNKNSFCRLPVTRAHSVIETEKHRDESISIKCYDDFYSWRYGQKKKLLDFYQKLTSFNQTYLSWFWIS